jgi:hypothetical protein
MTLQNRERVNNSTVLQVTVKLESLTRSLRFAVL